MFENSVVKSDSGLAVNQVVSRQISEVQAASYMAKMYPRNEMDASMRIRKMCERESLAKSATYSYSRSGSNISGPSIRLAEAIAQAWGNIDYGIIEMSNQGDMSEMMAYAWDLETNVRRSMIFSVKHERDTRNGKKELTDNRDIYELVANMGARRVRACILGVIPGDIVEEAVECCRKTVAKALKGDTSMTTEERVKNMLQNFDKRFKVSRTQIEKFIGRKAESFDENDLVTLAEVFQTLKDGAAKREDYFVFDTVKDVFADEPESEVKKNDSTEQ